MGFEARAKLGCQLSSLSRMARRSRQVANQHPPILEDLQIPADYNLSHSNESMMLWDSGWKVKTKRSFLWLGAHQQTRLQCWTLSTGCWMVHSSLLPTCSANFSHFTAFSPKTGTFHYSMNFCQGKRYFYTRTYLKS